jgi:hypothetical protein
MLWIAFASLVAAAVVAFARGKGRIFERVFGLHIAVGRWFGNCFSPAVVVELPSYPATWIIVTIRSTVGLETKFYAGPKGCHFNSGHLARWFGKRIEADFGDWHQVRLPLLGCHTDL